MERILSSTAGGGGSNSNSRTMNTNLSIAKKSMKSSTIPRRTQEQPQQPHSSNSLRLPPVPNQSINNHRRPTTSSHNQPLKSSILANKGSHGSKSSNAGPSAASRQTPPNMNNRVGSMKSNVNANLTKLQARPPANNKPVPRTTGLSSKTRAPKPVTTKMTPSAAPMNHRPRAVRPGGGAGQQTDPNVREGTHMRSMKTNNNTQSVSNKGMAPVVAKGSALTRAFGRKSGPVRTNFAPPGSRTGVSNRSPATVDARSAKGKAKIKPKSKNGVRTRPDGGGDSRLANRFGGGPGVNGARRGRATMLGLSRGPVGGRMGGQGGVTAVGGGNIRGGRTAGRPLARPQVNRGLRLEDIYGDESDDWIIDDDNDDEWRKEMKNTGFDYEKYKHIKADDVMVSSNMQLRKEEINASRIAAIEDIQEQRKLEMIGDDDGYEDDGYEDEDELEDDDFIVNG